MQTASFNSPPLARLYLRNTMLEHKHIALEGLKALIVDAERVESLDEQLEICQHSLQSARRDNETHQRVRKDTERLLQKIQTLMEETFGITPDGSSPLQNLIDPETWATRVCAEYARVLRENEELRAQLGENQ